jgi:lipopolysaccharide export system permease protein
MLKVTTRYICAQLIPTFLVGFIFFVAFLNTFYMFRLLSLIVDKGVELKTVLMMVFNLSISFFPLAAPLSFFFSTIYVLGKLSEDSEIIAMRSFGMTKFQIYTPFLIVSLSAAFAINSLSAVLIPKANADFKNTVVMLTSTGMLSSIKSGQFFTDIPNATLFAQKVSEDGNGFENVFLHSSDKAKLEEKIIFSKYGTLIKIYADQWHAPSLRLHLKDGNIVHLDKLGEKTEKILFQEYDFPIFNTDFAVQMMNKDSMKTNDELLKIIDSKYIDYENSLKDKKIKVEEVLDKKKSAYKSANEYYSRLVVFTQIVLFVFVAFTLGIKKGRGKGNNNAMKAGVVLIGYFVVYFFMLSISQKGRVDPIFANFAPSVLLFMVGIKFYKELDWAN